MRKLVEAVLENLSSKEVFRFRVICGSCGAEYGNRPMRFSKGTVPSTTQGDQIIHHILYEQEFKTAKEVAIRNAAEQMNYCPVCKRLICNRCFLICDELDLCKECAAYLDQRGNPVLTSFFDGK